MKYFKSRVHGCGMKRTSTKLITLIKNDVNTKIITQDYGKYPIKLPAGKGKYMKASEHSNSRKQGNE